MTTILKWLYELIFSTPYTDKGYYSALIMLILSVMILAVFVFIVLDCSNDFFGNWAYYSGKLIDKKYSAASHHQLESKNYERVNVYPDCCWCCFTALWIKRVDRLFNEERLRHIQGVQDRGH